MTTPLDICPHDDVPAACVDCLMGKPPERPNRPPAPPERDGPSWLAKFPGHCSGCNLALHEGQNICHMTDGSYRHLTCSSPGPALRAEGYR